jgi:hypothetical protein
MTDNGLNSLLIDDYLALISEGQVSSYQGFVGFKFGYDIHKPVKAQRVETIWVLYA